MKVNDLMLEEYEIYEVYEIDKHNRQDMNLAAELLSGNSGVYRSLTPSKIAQRIGGRGKLFGLYFNGVVVGTIAIKYIKFNGLDVGEIGFFYIHPDHVTAKNALIMLKAIKPYAKKFDLAFTMTAAKNIPMTAMLSRSSLVSLVFQARSPFTNKILNFWMADADNGSLSDDQKIEELKNRFAELMK